MSDQDLSKLFTIKSPCSEDWNSMRGTDLIRFCNHCQLSVRDISNLNRKQFRRLVARSRGRLCVRYVEPLAYMPPSARVLHKISRRAGILATGAFTASLTLPGAIASNLRNPVGNISSVPYAAITSRSTAPLSLGTATIAGTILDPNGAVIPGVNVSLTRMETNNVLSTTTDDAGVYTFEGLEPGTYNLKFEAKGFETGDVPNLTVRADDNNRIDQTLSIAPVTAQVTVESRQIVVMGGVAMPSPTQPLVKAADMDDLDGLNEALRNNPDANIRDQLTGYNALECAVKNGNREIIQALLAAKANVNSRDRNGLTPLMMIDEESTPDLVLDLINAGAKVNVRDDEGETALMATATVNNPEVLKALLDSGAKVNVSNNEGVTALMLAAEEGHVNNVRILILAGADVNARDKSGKTALDYAEENERPATIRFLKQYGAVTFNHRQDTQ